MSASSLHRESTDSLILYFMLCKLSIVSGFDCVSCGCDYVVLYMYMYMYVIIYIYSLLSFPTSIVYCSLKDNNLTQWLRHSSPQHPSLAVGELTGVSST